jgi:glycerophosphoryl diester phosphodiesterase
VTAHSHRRLLYAHRGASAELPENTLAAFERGLEAGADAIETDAHMTRDGHIVLSHDPTGERTAGVPLAIAEVSLAEVRTWDAGHGFLVGRERPFAGRGHRVPTLEEILTSLPAVPVNLDVKQRQPGMITRLLELLRRHGAEERVRITSFDAATVRQVRRAGFQGRVGLARNDVLRLLLPPALGPRTARGDAIQIPTSAFGINLARPDRLARWHELGLRVDYWVINEPATAVRLLALGADGIMTDDPARIAPVMRSATPESKPMPQ